MRGLRDRAGRFLKITQVAPAAEMAAAVSIPVIASGGLARVEDISALRKAGGARPIAGTILGRALYDGDIDPQAAIDAAGAR